ncbi:hypothetical protein E2C01_037566 [Portunus trituberculatus]|uniref:Uncharacterized protein n=1 Tax=Portunus trituberculatus TaxID=210409 RepID=A0A5B7F9P5_PORTR|nr:hypothetical protein [Portunus trituberculatus]
MALVFFSHHWDTHFSVLNDEAQRMLRRGEHRAIILRPQFISESYNVVVDSLTQEPQRSGNFSPSSGCHGVHPSSSLHRSGHARNGSYICYRLPCSMDRLCAAVSLPSLPCRSPYASADCVETVQRLLRHQGFSRGVAKFLDCHLSLSAMKGYKAMLNTVVRLKGFDLSSQPVLREVIRTFEQRDPTCPLSKTAISYFLWQLIRAAHEDFLDHLVLTLRAVYRVQDGIFSLGPIVAAVSVIP